MMRKNLPPAPASFAHKLIYTNAEFLAAREAFIDDLLDTNMLNEHDLKAFDGEGISKLIDLSLIKERTIAEMSNLQAQLEKSSDYLDELEAKENSAQALIVRGTKIPWWYTVVIAGLSLAPGISIGKLMEFWVPFAFGAYTIGFLGGAALFLGGKHLLELVFRDAILSPYSKPNERSIEQKLRLRGFITFVIVDAVISGVSILMSMVVDGVAFDLWSFLLFALSVGFSFLTASIIDEIARKDRGAIRAQMEQLGNNILKAYEWHEKFKAELKKYRRQKKTLERDMKALSKFLMDTEAQYRQTLLQVFGVEYLERSGTDLSRSRNTSRLRTKNRTIPTQSGKDRRNAEPNSARLLENQEVSLGSDRTSSVEEAFPLSARNGKYPDTASDDPDLDSSIS
ncbi:hypothetical protein ACQ4M4_10960 [Leptolyngbya sp. AN02str]|uniref:hypothetical protein n=1 Tax=Leptolyngbya sp. AN02str TaxID=3423363 RepID=UPI003D32232B